jgi:hypothetical protein
MSDLEYKEVASDIEMTLKKITDITGGQNITSNNLVESINTVSNAEDCYYVLTYAPQDPDHAGKLKIKVSNKKYKVFYDDNFRVDYITEYIQKLEEKIKTPAIKIKNFSFREKILAFTINDFMMKREGTGSVGRMKVRVRLTNSDNILTLYDRENLLTAYQEQMKISLPIAKEMEAGEYYFIIDAIDLLTGREANIHCNILINK